MVLKSFFSIPTLKHRLWLPVLVLGGLVALASIFHALTGADGSLARVRAQGVLRVGYAVAPPYVSVDNGDVPTGLAVDDIPALAKALGISRIEWVQTSYAKLVPDLLDRRYDMATGQLKSAVRAAQARFSAPVLVVPYGILVLRGNPHGVVPYGQLKPRTGLKVAVIQESVSDEQLRARGFADDHLVLVTEGDGGEAALRAGAAQALARTVPTLKRIIADHPDDFELIEDPTESTSMGLEMGFVFHPDDVALLDAWNAEMARQRISKRQ